MTYIFVVDNRTERSKERMHLVAYGCLSEYDAPNLQAKMSRNKSFRSIKLEVTLVSEMHAFLLCI